MLYQIRNIDNKWQVGKYFMYDWIVNSIYETEQEAIAKCNDLNKMFRR